MIRADYGCEKMVEDQYSKVIDIHPFVWLREKRNIESVREISDCIELLSFREITIEEYNMYPGD